MNPSSNSSTLEEIQREIGSWRRHNFPRQQPHQPLLGVIEEVGELVTALEQPNMEDEEVKDAIADIAIFLINYAEQRRYFLWLGDKSILPPTMARYFSTVSGLVINVAALSHAHLKEEQGIRRNEDHVSNQRQAIVDLVYLLDSVSREHLGVSLKEILIPVWKQVQMRDWIKYPRNGRTE